MVGEGYLLFLLLCQSIHSLETDSDSCFWWCCQPHHLLGTAATFRVNTRFFGPVCKEPTKCSSQRFPSLVKAHLHCCKPSVSKNSSHMWHTLYNVPLQCMLFCEEGMGLVTFYRGWKRGSKLPRSGVSHGGALGNGAAALHPKTVHPTSTSQTTRQNAHLQPEVLPLAEGKVMRWGRSVSSEMGSPASV